LRIVRQLCFELIPSLQLCLEDGLRSALDLHLVVVDQLLKVLRVGVPGLPLVIRSRRSHGVLQNRLLLLGQALELRLVEQNFERLGGLMIGAHVVEFGDVLGAEAEVGGRVVILEGLNDAAVHGGQNLRPGELSDAQTHRLEEIAGEPDGTILHTFEVIRPTDLPFEPAQRLRRHCEPEEADHVQLQNVLNELVIEFEATTVIDPRKELVGGEPIGRTGAEQRCSPMLAVPVGGHAVCTVENAAVAAIHDRERLYDGAGVQIVDFETAFAQLVDDLHEILGHLVQHVLSAPGALHLERDGFGTRNLRHRDRCRARHGGAGEEFTPGRHCGFLF